MKLMLVRDRNVLNTNWLAYFANLLVDAGHEVIIACDTYSKLGKSAPGFELDERVRVINLNAPTQSTVANIYRQIRGKLLPSWFRFNKLIKNEQPDVIVCYFPVDLFNVTRFQHHNIPIVQMVHNYPPIITRKIEKNMWLNRSSVRQIHTWQVLMNSYKNDLNPQLEPKNIVRIANPVKQYKTEEMIDLSEEKKRIVYVARIEKSVKQPHLLVEAFAKIAKDFPDWKVEIWGLRKYPEYDKEIEDIIVNNNMENQVKLMGYGTDVEAIYRSADIHAFPSNCEGFSLAIADAMAMGLPHIGFNYAHSVNEIIKDNHNGFLVNDVDEFAEKLAILMKDKELRIKFGKNAHEDMKAYAPEVIISKWNELFNSITKK